MSLRVELNQLSESTAVKSASKTEKEIKLFTGNSSEETKSFNEIMGWSGRSVSNSYPVDKYIEENFPKKLYWNRKIKNKGNNIYEIQWKENGTKFIVFLTVNLAENSFTVNHVKNKKSESYDLESAYNRYDDKGRVIEERQENFDGYTVRAKFEYDAKGNVIKQITDDGNGNEYTCEVHTYDDNGRHTSRITTDKDGNQIEATKWAYDSENRYTRIEIYGENKNTPKVVKTFERSTDGQNMILTENHSDGRKITKQCQKPNIGGSWYSDCYLLMEETCVKDGEEFYTKHYSYTKEKSALGQEGLYVNTLATGKGYVTKNKERVSGMYEYIFK